METQEKALKVSAPIKEDLIGIRVRDHNYAKRMLSGKTTDPLVTDSALSGTLSQDSNLQN